MQFLNNFYLNRQEVLRNLQGDSMEMHHKVPRFLGGSDEGWNLELISTQVHLDRHIMIAEEIGTFEAWRSCVLIIARTPQLIYDWSYISKKLSVSQRGNKNPFFNKKHTNETKQKMSKLAMGRISPTKGTKKTEEFKQKMSDTKNIGDYYCGDFGVFNSPRIAEKFCNIRRTSIMKRCKSKNFKDWYFVPNGDKNEI